MIKHKFINARKERNMTQNELAVMVGMSQSQYQRREQGEIRISEDEWARIAKKLEKEVEDIKEEDPVTTITNYDNHSANYSASNNYFYSIPEFIMKNQQEYIEMLKEEIKRLSEENKRLNGEINRLKDKGSPNL